MKKRKLLSILLVGLLSTTIFVGCTSNGDDQAKEPSNEEEPVLVEEIEVFENPEVDSPEDALALLKEGNDRFSSNESVDFDLGDAKRNELTDGQNPFAVVVTCSDSRVVPEHLFNQGLGDLFVIRVAGNILDKAEIGSIEYAVDHLESPLVVILGHESCGAVETAVAKDENPDETPTTEYIDSFLDNIESSVEKAKEEDLEGAELVEEVSSLNVKSAVDQLLKDSDIVKENADENKVEVIGAKYLLENGAIEWFE